MSDTERQGPSPIERAAEIIGGHGSVDTDCACGACASTLLADYTRGLCGYAKGSDGTRGGWFSVGEEGPELTRRDR